MDPSKVTIQNINDPFLGRKKKYQLRVQAVKNYIEDNPGAAITLEDFKKIAHYSSDPSAHALIKSLLEDKEIFRTRLPHSNKFSYWTSSIPKSSGSAALPATPSVPKKPVTVAQPTQAPIQHKTIKKEVNTKKYSLTLIVSDSATSSSPKISIELNNVDVNSIENIVETAVEQL